MFCETDQRVFFVKQVRTLSSTPTVDNELLNELKREVAELRKLAMTQSSEAALAKENRKQTEPCPTQTCDKPSRGVQKEASAEVDDVQEVVGGWRGPPSSSSSSLDARLKLIEEQVFAQKYAKPASAESSIVPHAHGGSLMPPTIPSLYPPATMYNGPGVHSPWERSPWERPPWGPSSTLPHHTGGWERWERPPAWSFFRPY